MTSPITPSELLAAIDSALLLLPARMTSYNARKMMLAICYQESNLQHRRQQPRGPARGYAQFEMGGMMGIMKHPATASYFAEAANELGLVNLPPNELHAAMERNDVWCMVCTRLNLWWYPEPLARTLSEGWKQYLAIWRPGKPHPDRWESSWQRAAQRLERA